MKIEKVLSEMDGATEERPIAVAMSGGLDSSVVAQLLSEAGHRVVGLSMLLWDGEQVRTNGRCCGSLDLGDAKRVAQQIGIPHYTLRLDREFKSKVVDPFVQDYLDGRTPSPCVRCNTWIKFDLLLERARELGLETVATGHYARRVRGADGLWQLHRARDLSKDQSYFLFELNQAQLNAARFPLGELRKSETRELARDGGLSVAEKGESMEVCFVSSSVREFVEERTATRGAPLSTEGARVVGHDGVEIGRADPYYRYTVGQRRGLGIGGGRRLYVLDVDAARNEIQVGPRDALLVRGLRGERLHWIGAPPDGVAAVEVQVRSRHEPVPATVHADGDAVEVYFERPVEAVTPGQAAVFYRGDRVLGGCWIEQPIARGPAPARSSRQTVELTS